MVDTPTTEYGLRQQALGENVDTWGDDKLNEVIRDIAQILGRVKDIAITGDYTITSTDYVDTADNKNRGWRFTGTLTANATITVPASRASFPVVNDTTGGFSLTVKTSAGTGITVPNARIALLYCNAVNVLNHFPTHMGTDFTPSLSGDVANVNYVDTAIANASIPAAAGTVLVSGGDTTAGYLGQKVAIQSTGLSTTQLAALSGVQIGSSGSDEDLLINAPFVGGFLNGGLQSSSFTPVVGYAYDLDATSASSTVDLSGMTTPQVGQEFKLNKFGAFPVCLLGTVNSNSNPIRTDTFNTVLRYCGASWGWNIMTSSGGGIHFTDPWEFLPRVFVAANLLLEENDGTDRTSATTAFFTAMAARGFQDTTNWTADTYKSLLSVSSGKGFLAALVGPTAGGSETTTFEITADGVTTEIAVAVASGERAVLSRLCLPGPTYTTASRFAIQGGTIDSGKTTIGTPGIDTLLGGWPLVEANGVPCLKFTQSLVIRAKHSANITNSTATAYSGGMYRLGL